MEACSWDLHWATGRLRSARWVMSLVVKIHSATKQANQRHGYDNAAAEASLTAPRGRLVEGSLDRLSKSNILPWQATMKFTRTTIVRYIK